MAEGAALEMPCTGNCTVGSNPTPSAIPIREGLPRWRQRFSGSWRRVLIRDPRSGAVLDGEVAVPCSPQSAIAGLNPLSRVARVE